MAIAAALPAVMSIGSAIAGGIGAKAAGDAQADAKFRAAQVARARAQQVDLASRQELEQTLSNIIAIRASSNADVYSPTTAAVLERQQEIGGRNRQARVSSESIRADNLEREGYAAGNAGNWGLAGGLIKAVPGFGSLFGSFNFGSSGASYASGGGASP